MNFFDNKENCLYLYTSQIYQKPRRYVIKEVEKALYAPFSVCLESYCHPPHRAGFSNRRTGLINRISPNNTYCFKIQGGARGYKYLIPMGFIVVYMFYNSGRCPGQKLHPPNPLSKGD